MTQSTFAALNATVVIVLLCYSILAAQEPLPRPASKHLAIEIVNDESDIQSPVLEPPSEGGMLETNPPYPLPDWKQPAGTVPLTRIRIRSILEGNAVRIKVAGVFDDSEPADAPGPKYGAIEKAIGSYLAREGETIRISELTRFGFEPLVLKVVKERPREKELPPVAPPEVNNKLKTVAVISFISEGVPSTFYRLKLQNISTKNIIALDVYVPSVGGRTSQSSEGTPARPVMTPGALYETSISINSGGRRTPQGYVPDPLPQSLVIGTVVFADGTYEGEADTAIQIIARLKARQIQIVRVLSLLQNLLDAPEQDAMAVLEKLKTQVATLRIDVDPAVVDELLARFPELPKDRDRKWLTRVLMNGLKNGREEMLYRIKDLEDARKRRPEAFDLRQQLNFVKEHLETITANR